MQQSIEPDILPCPARRRGRGKDAEGGEGEGLSTTRPTGAHPDLLRESVPLPRAGKGGARTWRERWIGARNRLLGSPAFQRWASATPIVRSIAQHRAGGLFDIVAGFVYSQIAFACIDSGLLDLLAESPQSAGDVATRADLPHDSAERLLRAAAALGLAEALGDGRYMLGAQGAALTGNGGIAAMIAHHRLLYADLADPLALLRRGGGGGQLSGYWPYAEGGLAEPARVADYSALMAASQPIVAAQVLDAWRFDRHRHLLDVGGGEGAFLAAVGARHPDLRLTLFDLPAVAERARARLGARAEVHGGDFISDPLPRGADVISLVRILHDHGDATVTALLAAAHRALDPGGTLVVAEPMASDGADMRIGDAYFGFYLLAMGSGRPRTAAELIAMLRATGFRRVRTVRTRLPMIARLIVAER